MADLSILLKWLVDKASTQEAKKSAGEVADSIEQVEKSAVSTGESLDELGDDFKKFTDQFAAQTDKQKQSFAAFVDRAQSGLDEIHDRFQRQIKDIKQSREEWARLRGVAEIGARFGQGMVVAGAGIIAPLALAAREYLQNTEDNTRLTKEWKEATDSIQASYGRVGKVAAQEILPFLKQASSVMSAVAGFVEENPELVRAALVTGGILVGIGTLTTLLAKGLRIYADVGYITTTAQLSATMALYKTTTDEFIAGVYAYATAQEKGVLDAALGRTGIPTRATGGGGALAGLGGVISKVFVTAAALYIGGEAGISLGNFLGRLAYGGQYKEQGLGDAFVTAMRVPAVALGALTQVLEKAGLVSDETAKEVSDLILGMDGYIRSAIDGKNKTDDLASAIGRLAGSEHEEEIVNSYMDMLDEENAATKQLAADIRGVQEEAGREIITAWRRNVNAVSAINKRASDTAIKLAQDYYKQDQQAEARFLEQRRKAVRDGGVEIQRIEEDSQRRIAEMRREHDRNMYDLASARDALGLVQAQRRYEEERQKEIENTNIEIGRRRQDLAQRLKDDADAFAAERAQRFADFQEKLKENEERKKEELAQAAKQYAEERKQIARQRDDKIRELNEQARAESLHRREAFIASIRNLDAALLGEQNIRDKFYADALRDAQKFFDDYRRALPSGSTITSTPTAPTHDFTGYASRGLWFLSKDGPSEFVLSGRDTRMLEQAVGGQLTGQSIVNRVSSGKNMVYNDNRVISSDVSEATRRALRQDAIEAMSYVLSQEEA